MATNLSAGCDLSAKTASESEISNESHSSIASLNNTFTLLSTVDDMLSESSDSRQLSVSSSSSRRPRTLNPRRESRKPLFECECALCHSHPISRRSNTASPSITGNQQKQVDTTLLLFPDSDRSSAFDESIPLTPDGSSRIQSSPSTTNLNTVVTPEPCVVLNNESKTSLSVGSTQKVVSPRELSSGKETPCGI